MEGLDYLGAADPKVYAAQVALLARGFKLPKYGADGDLGDETRAAITAFWASKGQSRAPVVDDDLMAALNATPIVQTPATPATPTSTKPTALVPAVDSPAATQPPAKMSSTKRYALVAAGIAAVLSAIGILYYSGGDKS